jgi:hypothetical protein
MEIFRNLSYFHFIFFAKHLTKIYFMINFIYLNLVYIFKYQISHDRNNLLILLESMVVEGGVFTEATPS